MDHSNILGTVLAGGKSQRFGEDKSQVKLDGKVLIDYILNEISVHRLCAAHRVAPSLGRIFCSERRVCTEMQRGIGIHKLVRLNER